MIIVSVVIRVRNERTWLSSTLQAITNQNFSGYEVVVVNHGSTDGSMDVAKEFGVRIVEYIPKSGKYRPGEMLNVGIRECNAKYYGLLSAHCVPKNANWIKEHVEEIEKSELYAGVYGKQLPFMYSPLADKRDLTIIFSDEPKDQSLDPFFHNANALIRNDCLFPDLFDESVTNIEDRVWARKVQSQGLKIRYSAKSPVMHYHGIHQSDSKDRLDSTNTVYNLLSGRVAGMRRNCKVSFVLSHRCDEEKSQLVRELLNRALRDIARIADNVEYLSVTTILPKNMGQAYSERMPEISQLEITRLERPDFLNAEWCSILDVLQYAEKQLDSEVTHLAYLDLHYALRDFRDIDKAVSHIRTEYSETGMTDALIFGCTAKRVIFNDDYGIHDILSRAFRPVSTGGLPENTLLVGGYCSIFDRDRISDTSLTGEGITLMNLESALSEIRVETIDELVRINGIR